MARCSGCGKILQEGLHSCPSCGGTAIPSRIERGLQPLHEPGELLGGRYRIERVLGTGASGVVYGVVDELVKARVALKLLWDRPEEGDGAFERLRREIKASQRAPHPHLVSIHDLILVEGRPGLVMEWVEGETLRERVRREGALPWGEAVRVGEALLSALAHLHGLGIVHRDVKSGNVLLGREGAVKLGDFGLVKGEDLGMSLTATGLSLGTPGYMAPEVIRGKEATASSDLYSLGVVLFEMLAGRQPFQGASGLEVVSRQLSEAPLLGPLRERRVPRWLVRLTARMLESDPSDRFPSAGAARKALEERRGLWLSRKARRSVAAALFTSALVAAACLGARWWRSHALPTLTSNGATLTAKDAFGRTLFTRTFPSPVQSACAGRFLPGGKPGVAVALAYNSADPRPAVDNGANLGNSILVMDAAGNTVVSRRIELGGHPFVPRYEVELSRHRFKAGEPDRLVAYAHHIPWYPAGILVFPPFTREALEGSLYQIQPTLFDSSGHMVRSFVFRDLNGDRTDDIAFTCVNNSLYKTYAAGVLFVTPAEASDPYTECSPDLHVATQGPRSWYRLLSFHYKFPDISWSEKPAGFLLQYQDRPFLRLGPDWSSSTPGAAAPSDLFWLNAWIGEICRLRSAGEWEGMLSKLSGDQRTFPPPYDWLKRLFTAHALMGLTRYDEALATLAEGPPIEDGGKPYAAYNLRLNALFLAGRYRECVTAFMGMPVAVQKDWADMGPTVFWAATYLGDDPLSRSFVSGSLVDRYPMPEAGALLAALQGDYLSGESLARAQKPLEGIHPGPALVLVDCLLMQGRTAEARSAMEAVKASFVGEGLDQGETELWLLWHEKPGNPALLRSMDSLVEAKRRMATSDVEVRALLPLTLARSARMHRDAADRARADELLKEALRLAPPSWKPALKTLGSES